MDMKMLIMFVFLFANTPQGPNTAVYICYGAKGKKYHLRSDCRGLSNCQHKVVKMSLASAEKDGRTLCGWEK
ncbi:MAG TPA: hypothetical protein VHZ50_10105, partial [Puia sp.]|nr:hypothetical protein [Puia sp.]